jgi:uncharacterized repeat protein (TIGR01451 family)
VNVTSAVAGSYLNSTGPVSSTNGGTGAAASATLKVANASLTIIKSHTPPIGINVTYTINVGNSATAGPTVGTVTVTDMLPLLMTATNMSGTGWTCSIVGTPTCTRSDVLLPGGSYPPITLTATFGANLTGQLDNIAKVSGGGDPNTHMFDDPLLLGAPLQIKSNGGNLQVTTGSTASMDFTVNSSNGLGAITFSCSGLPVGASCGFNPQSESQLTATVTMTVSASVGSAPLTAQTPAITPPLYAALLPILGLLGFGVGRKKGKAARLRLAMLLAGILMLLAFVGCGGGSFRQTGTPAGTFPITVSATSASTGQSASTVVNLTVISQGPQH